MAFQNYDITQIQIVHLNIKSSGGSYGYPSGGSLDMVNEPQEEFPCLPLYSCIVAKVMEEFRQKTRICKKCHEPFLQDAGGYTTICISCWIATREIDPIQKIAEAIRIEKVMLDNIAANIREQKAKKKPR